jgi:hypothetical protein
MCCCVVLVDALIDCHLSLSLFDELCFRIFSYFLRTNLGELSAFLQFASYENAKILMPDNKKLI